jgi:hypothetical protein
MAGGWRFSHGWGSDLVEFVFHAFVEGKEGCEEQMVPSVAGFQG